VGGFIVLEDGRAFALNNWATNVIVQTIAVELPAGELRNWLLFQQSTIQGPGMTRIDLRELTPANAEAIVAAIRRINADVTRYDLPDDADWRAHFQLLADMVDACERGDPPMDLNPHMLAVSPPTGARRGPGWPQGTDR
jgi:hypothetical protein